MNALEQNREDAALGAAWRRATDAMPFGWQLGGVIQRGSNGDRWQAVALPRGVLGNVGIGKMADQSTVATYEGARCPTPIEALEALVHELTS